MLSETADSSVHTFGIRASKLTASNGEEIASLTTILFSYFCFAKEKHIFHPETFLKISKTIANDEKTLATLCCGARISDTKGFDVTRKTSLSLRVDPKINADKWKRSPLEDMSSTLVNLDTCTDHSRRRDSRGPTSLHEDFPHRLVTFSVTGF